MKKFTRAISKLLLVAMIAILLSGCDYSHYRGDYPELHTIMKNSALGIHHTRGGKVAPLAEDDFGRRMFAYLAHITASPNPSATYTIAVAVCQKAGIRYVYYYPDDCFVLFEMDQDIYYGQERTEENFVREVWALITDEDLETLKEMNDWGKPLDETRCEKKEISRNTGGGSLTKEQKQEFMSKINCEDAEFIHMTSDGYGREIYFSRVLDAEGKYGDAYAVMFFGSEKFECVKIVDLLDYRKQIKTFKAGNKWGVDMNG